jgi:AcrR family transcriptional regulator
MEPRESSTTRSAGATLATPPRAGDWRGRLRLAAYALCRRRRRNPAEFEAEVQELVELIDEGRGEPEAPRSLTRVTAEALGGAIFHELSLAARAGAPPESELVPGLMYLAVLPYAGVDAATEELRTPPPPR